MTDQTNKATGLKLFSQDATLLGIIQLHDDEDNPLAEVGFSHEQLDAMVAHISSLSQHLKSVEKKKQDEADEAAMREAVKAEGELQEELDDDRPESA